MSQIYETRWLRTYKPACRTFLESGLEHIILISNSLTVTFVRQRLLRVQQNDATLSF